MLGILTGLAEEAKLASRSFPDAKIALSHARKEQGEKALQELLKAGVTQLLSFGCAGGLDPSCPPGTLIVPDYIYVDGKSYSCDIKMTERYRRESVLKGGLFHSDHMIETSLQKQQLWKETGCSAVDMESGLVVSSGLPFAVLRVICDDASQDVPPAAAKGLRDGKINVPGLIGSLFRQPSQIPALITLGKNAAMARRIMASYLSDLS